MSTTKNFNPGIAIFRVLMCFEVIYIHFNAYGTSSAAETILESLIPCAATGFMLMSFFLTGKRFDALKKRWLTKRLMALWTPLPGWTIIYCIGLVPFVIMGYRSITASDILWQILTGHTESINPSMWFQFDILVITALFALLFLYFRRYVITGLVILCVLSFVMQYTGINTTVHQGLRYELYYPLGRLYETIPFAVAGYFLYRIITTLDSSHRMALAACATMALVFAGAMAARCLDIKEGFNYPGITTFLAVISLFCFSYYAGRFIRQSAWPFIERYSKYTLGIYCIHRLLGLYFLSALTILNISIPSILLVLIIYILSFVSCLLLSRINIKAVSLLID